MAFGQKKYGSAGSDIAWSGIYNKIATLIILLSSAFWLYYIALQSAFSPLSSDENYMSHIIWMVNTGYRQYYDFHSFHLPFYFWIAHGASIFLSAQADDLSYILAIRLLFSFLAVFYIIFYVALAKKAAIGREPTWQSIVATIPFLGVFLVFGRMLEIRPDAASLWLVNLAWFCILSAALTRDRRRFELLLVAGAIAGITSLGFSARAAVVSLGIALSILLLVVGQRQWRALYMLSAVGLAAVLVAVSALITYPDFIHKVYYAAFVEPRIVMGAVPLSTRLFDPPRMAMMICILGACAGFVVSWRAGRFYFAATSIIACITQIVLILVDPSPFGYVYGYATVPSLVGWLVLGNVKTRFDLGGVSIFLWAAGAALTAAITMACAAYIVVKHRDPPAGSILRIRFDSPLSARTIAALPTERLVTSILNDRRQNIFDDIAVHSALCTRLNGKVLVVPASHPICVPDVSRNWSSFPAIDQGANWPDDRTAAAANRHLFEPDKPVLVIWRTWGIKADAEPPAWISLNLGQCYRRYPGFALLMARCRNASR
jgi:hypothetical protein